MTQWRVINRLRAIAEHGGLEASPDRRVTTHNVRQSLAGPVLVRPLQHRVAPGPPRGHGRPVPQPARRSTPSWSGPATSPRGSPIPTTARCGGPWPRPERPSPARPRIRPAGPAGPGRPGPGPPSSCPGRRGRGRPASLRAGASSPAMTLPSSTPHWSNESMPQTAPSANTVCS